MKKFVIIDGNNLIFRAFYALPQLSNFKGEISNAVFGFSTMLLKIITEEKPDYIAVAFDKGKKTFRHEKFAEYKGTRKPTPPELKSQFPILKDLLKKMNVQVLEMDLIEADDLIGTLSKMFDTENVIVSADQDVLQLISKNTSVLSPKKGITETFLYNLDTLKQVYGVEPYQIIELKSLMGDSSDNIPGVSGVGEKTALTLVQKYSNLDGVYAHLEEQKGKSLEKLTNDKDMAYLSHELATIKTDVPLEYKLEDFRYDFPFNAEVRDIFRRYQFNSLLKRDEIFDENNTGIDTKNIDIEIKTIENIDDLNLVIKSIEKDKELVIDFGEKLSIYAGGVEYQVSTFGDLINLPIDTSDVLRKLKDCFENSQIGKILFSKKNTLYRLRDLGIVLNGKIYDIAIARYLANANLKPIATVKELSRELEIDEKYGAYTLKCAKDYLFGKIDEMKLNKLYNDIELPLVDVLYDMETFGFKVDRETLKKLETMYDERLKDLSNKIYDLAGKKFNINSPKQLGEVLFTDMGISTYGNKKKSTSVDILSELSGEYEIVDLILEYRTLYKLESTYIKAFYDILDKNDKIHTVFNQTLTATGRLSSSEPNLQNIPVRSEEGKNIRKAFVSSFPNGQILSADYSQIELRLLAHFSEDPKLLYAYHNGLDIHASTASQIFDVPLEQVTPNMRRDAKAINFGIIYGISEYGLSKNIGSTRKSAKEIIDKYFAEHSKVKEYMDSNVSFAKEHGYMMTLMGRIRPIPEISSSNFNLRTFGERVAMNMPLQGTASDIIKLAMVNVYKELKKANLRSKMIVQVHDELVIDCDDGEVEKVEKIVKDCMENVVKLSVPIPVNISYGKTWFDAK